jgi:Coenzyme PQQ synthesis protein D (PqqD)
MRFQKMTSDSVIIRQRDTLTAALDDSLILLGIKAGSYFDLNRTAAGIWQLLDTPRRIGDIVELLLQQYDTDRSTVNQDVIAFLQLLKDRRLIRVLDVRRE